MAYGFVSRQNVRSTVRGAEFTPATSSFLGGVIVDNTSITVDVAGVISVGPEVSSTNILASNIESYTATCTKANITDATLSTLSVTDVTSDTMIIDTSLKVADNVSITSGCLYIPSGVNIYSPGMIVQAIPFRYDTRTTYTSGTGASGVRMAALTQSITPKFANSLIFCQWLIHGETAHTDTMFNMYKDGAIATASGYEGYNSAVGNAVYSGLTHIGAYETNYSSTPSTQPVYFWDAPGDTSSHDYCPGYKSSAAASRIFYLNRCVASAGANAYEIGVTFGWIMEIAQ